MGFSWYPLAQKPMPTPTAQARTAAAIGAGMIDFDAFASIG
jgi:hypothetical protein